MSEWTGADIIRIEGLRLPGSHGVHDFEKAEVHPFVFDISCRMDLSAAGHSDDLKDTVSYSDVCRAVKEINESASFDLIETLAEKTALELLHRFNPLKGVTVKVSKPEAPVPEEFDDISVTVERSWHRISISFGSNIGDSEGIIKSMLEELSGSGLFKDITVSDIIRTRPYGVKDQPDFLNGCLTAHTVLNPRGLLKFCMDTEKKYGRERALRWGPRTLDMDILFYDDFIIDEPDLVIPHYDMKNRDFVLKPLNDIAGYLMHPVYKKTVKEMYTELCERSGLL